MDNKVKRRLFGTDGIRGTANTAPMTPEMALKLGQAAGLLFTRGDHRHRVIIGKDTRLSGYMLEPALTAGFISAGMNVTLAGPLPTPAIAMLTRSLRLDLGVVISASHNPFEDNGIKLFGPDGNKLSDETEQEIEALMAQDLSDRLAPPAKLGRAARLVDAAGRYIEAAKSSLPRGLRLDGLRIVLDCAHGAAYKVAPAALFELGAEVIPLGVNPDGFNINREAGSTAPRQLCEAVLEHGADIGIALDGDADRVILADEHGEIIDGDQILGLIARDMHAQGRLAGGGIVATVMSNLGLERFLRRTRPHPHPHQGGRPLCGGGDARDGHQFGRRAVRPCHPLGFRHHGRRPRSGAPGAGRAGALGQTRLRGLPRLRAAAAASAQCALCRDLAAQASAHPNRDRGRRRAPGHGRPGADPPLRHRAADPRDGRG